ncbi:MAG: hypothetical protein QOI20_3242 [Acidimicrobiaceae bacterium]|jgi:hypothetical protein|nr:hypothetical protein [Acidimicrobiaceae bacterium]
MSDATRGLRSSIAARLLACDEAELRAMDADLLAIEQLRDITAPRLQIEIARERLYIAAGQLIDDELERAALAFAVAVRDQRQITTPRRGRCDGPIQCARCAAIAQDNASAAAELVAEVCHAPK